MEYSIQSWALTKRFGPITAVEDLSLTVEPGQVFGLLGPNGAGKSTFVKMLVGLVRPTSGWCQVLGLPPNHHSAKRQLSYLPELFRFPPWLTARELLRFHGRLLGLEGSRLESQIGWALEQTRLAQAADRKIGGYSKGMQQRVGLAQAILGRPKVLFLDEPTSALDPRGRVEVRELLAELSAEGATVFLNSHLLTDVEKMCRRVAIMSRGRVIRAGETASLSSGVRLEVEVDQLPERVLTRLERDFGAVTALNGQPKFALEMMDREKIPDIASFLVREGLRVYRLESASTSLEDTFLELIEEGEQD